MTMKAGSQVLRDFSATAKRTGTALHSLKDELLRRGMISEKEAMLLVEAGAVLTQVTPALDRKKAAAKKAEAEAQALLERMSRETQQAVEAVFKGLGIDESVAFLVFRHESLNDIKSNLPLKRECFPYSDSNVYAALRSSLNDAIRDVVHELSWKAKNSDDVAILVDKVKCDFEANRPDILRRMSGFIGEVNAAAVAQALHKANKPVAISR